ncbi:MAG TPA: N-acetyl-gamma-glutamyl-phosphate reductase [Trueperaceae bacterium]
MSDTRIKVGILGASGYGGAELLRRLVRHPHAEVTGIGSRQYLGQPLEACWPQYAGQLTELRFADTDEVIAGCELLFTATPHAETAPLVKRALDAGKKVVDLSADFRLAPEEYARWYGHAHPHPELCNEAVYGLVELHRRETRGARLVANPGCNASTASLALAPLAACGLLGPDVIVNIATGVSGAGRSPALGVHYAEVNENVRPYKVAGGHRHIAEVEDTLGRAQQMGRHLQTRAVDSRPVVSFNPHLVPMSRGILATCYTRPPAGEGPQDDAGLLALYRDFYQGEPLLEVISDLPQTKAVAGTDRCLLNVRRDARTGHIIAFGAIDNLGKGAAGQAVQNFNVMLGFEETLGLALQAVWP